jgi:hypothetical protein
MFVRFRERRNDALEPYGEATRLCTGRCHKRDGRRVGIVRHGQGCPEQPRCRWRAAGGLVPYRLLVGLIEGRRIDGKVRQDHVADLGAIDGALLPAFYAGLDAETAQAVRGDPDWCHRSVVARLAFWVELDARLARLANRIDDDQAALVRQAVQVRIPQPTAGELAEGEALEWRRLQDGYQGIVDGDQREIESLERHIADKRAGIALLQPVVADIAANMPVGAEKRQLQDLLLYVLARRAGAKVGPIGPS